MLFEQHKLRSKACQHCNGDGLSARLKVDAGTAATAAAAVELNVGCTLRMVPEVVEIVSVVEQQHNYSHGRLGVVCSALSDVYKIHHVEAYVRAEMQRCVVCS